MSDVFVLDESPFCAELPPPDPGLWEEDEKLEFGFAGVEFGIFRGFANDAMTVARRQATARCGHILLLEGGAPFADARNLCLLSPPVPVVSSLLSSTSIHDQRTRCNCGMRIFSTSLSIRNCWIAAAHPLGWAVSGECTSTDVAQAAPIPRWTHVTSTGTPMFSFVPKKETIAN